jgi:hypothetical protein
MLRDLLCRASGLLEPAHEGDESAAIFSAFGRILRMRVRSLCLNVTRLQI